MRPCGRVPEAVSRLEHGLVLSTPCHVFRLQPTRGPSLCESPHQNNSLSRPAFASPRVLGLKAARPSVFATVWKGTQGRQFGVGKCRDFIIPLPASGTVLCYPRLAMFFGLRRRVALHFLFESHQVRFALRTPFVRGLRVGTTPGPGLQPQLALGVKLTINKGLAVFRPSPVYSRGRRLSHLEFSSSTGKGLRVSILAVPPMRRDSA